VRGIVLTRRLWSRVKRAAGEALRSLDFNLHKDSRNEMEASKRRHISAIVGAGGERLILHFKKAQQGQALPF